MQCCRLPTANRAASKTHSSFQSTKPLKSDAGVFEFRTTVPDQQISEIQIVVEVHSTVFTAEALATESGLALVVTNG